MCGHKRSELTALREENARLRVELGEIKLVLESQDIRIHRYHEALEKIAKGAQKKLCPEYHDCDCAGEVAREALKGEEK
jgi:hypothetical protein